MKRCFLAGNLVLIFMLTSLILGDEIPILWAQDKPGLAAEWERTVAAARKEGQVTIFFTLGPHRTIEDFQKAYPKIKVIGVFGRSSGLVQRMMTERRAGKYFPDARVGGGGRYFDKLVPHSNPVKPILMLPEVVDESKWFEGAHRYADREKRYFFSFIGAPQLGSVNYNTNLVDPKEIKSFWDLVDDKWKGKIVIRDPRGGGPGGGAMRFLYHNPQLGPKFIRRLFGEMNITLTRSERQATDWLAIGKYPICFFCRGIELAARQGLPVNEFGLMKEGAGITSKGGIVSFIDRAPHPNAAKVFINWLLSREGQMAYMKRIKAAEGRAADSLRMDVPKDGVSPQQRRQKGVKYVDVDSAETRNMRPIFKIIAQALNQAGKKQ